jgi:hypothetical protein
MTALRSFNGLAVAIQGQGNPRLAAGLSSEQWDRKRRAERRKAWEARAQQHAVAGPTVRDSTLPPTQADLVQRLRTESCIGKNVPLYISSALARPERGMHPRAYYTTKLARLGTLGEHATLNPFHRELMRGGK